jgi:hypothetical protein
MWLSVWRRYCAAWILLVLLSRGEVLAQSVTDQEESPGDARPLQSISELAEGSREAQPAQPIADATAAGGKPPLTESRPQSALRVDQTADRRAAMPPADAESSAPSGSGSVDARGAWPIAAALVLGPVAHGAGHFVAGQHASALRLLAAEGIGVLAAVGGLAGLAVTGASEKTTAPLAGLTAFGVGLFGTSLLADVYGVVTPPGGFGQAVLRPALVAEAGAFGVIDPVFDYDALAFVAGRAFLGRHSLSLEGHIGVDHDNQRLRGIYAYRFIERDAATYLEAELGALHHRYAPEQFSMSFGEAAISGRLGLGHVAPTLHGAFVEGAFGLAFGGHRYFDVETESDSMLLMRMGFGVFIGDGGSWTLYYDHRHDGYAAGLKMFGLGSGVLGHFGTLLQYYFSPQWGLAARAETGSAHVLGVSVLFRRMRW